MSCIAIVLIILLVGIPALMAAQRAKKQEKKGINFIRFRDNDNKTVKSRGRKSSTFQQFERSRSSRASGQSTVLGPARQLSLQSPDAPIRYPVAPNNKKKPRVYTIPVY